MKNSNKVVMFNPINNVRIITTKEFQKNWEKLGFIVTDKVILFQLAC